MRSGGRWSVEGLSEVDIPYFFSKGDPIPELEITLGFVTAYI